MICQTANLARLIATKLSLNDLFNFCLIGKTCSASVSSSQSFWRLKYKKDNQGDDSHPKNNNWLEYYRIAMQTLYTNRSIGFKLIPISRAVVKVSSGSSHFGFLTIDQNFYIWGSNMFGQLGLPSTIETSEITLVSQNVKWILCQHDYSFYGHENSNCYMTGSLGIYLYGWRLFDKDIIDVYSYPRLKHPIAYLKSTHDLYFRSTSPVQIQEYESDTTLIAHNVKSICLSYHNVAFIDDNNDYYIYESEKITLVGTHMIRACDLDEEAIFLKDDGVLAFRQNTELYLIGNNVIDFRLKEFSGQIYALAYLTSDRSVYICGRILFHMGLFSEELFETLLNLFKTEHWVAIKRILNQNRDRFPVVNLNDLSEEKLKSYLLELSIEERKKFVALLPLRFLNLAQYQSLLTPTYFTSNVVDFDVTFKYIFAIKEEPGDSGIRKYL